MSIENKISITILTKNSQKYIAEYLASLVYPSSYSNIKEVRTGIGGHINTYNTERLHSALDYLTPDEAYYKGANKKCFDAKSVLLEVA